MPRPIDHPLDPTVEASLRLDLDPVVAARRQRIRAIRFHTLEVPALRLAGCLLLLGLVALHGRFLLSDMEWPLFRAFALITVAYALGSWWILRWFYSRIRRFDLGFTFLNLDLLLWVFAIYVSGGTKSWLILLLLVRVADQANTTFRRTAYFVHLGAGLYLAMLCHLAWIEGRPVSWGGEFAKLSIIYGTGFYVALTARTAERLRSQTRAAIKVARRSIRDLEVQSLELMNSRRAAEEASRLKGQFLATVSHELLTPLNGIRGMTDLALGTQLDPEQRDYLETARASARDLEQLVGQVIDYANLDMGSSEPRTRTFSPRECLTEVLKSVGPFAERKGLELALRIDDKIPALLIGDADTLREAIEPLLSNAVKFTDHGSVLLSASSEIRTPQKARVRFSVTDTGIGIPPETQALIFQPFRQGDGSRTRRHGGLGLGLATVARLAERMQGYAWVDSEVGRGSTFHLAVEFGRPGGKAMEPTEVPHAPAPTSDSDETPEDEDRPPFAFDFAAAAARLGGDQELLREVALVLRDEWQEQSATVAMALSAGDAVGAGRGLHSIKGSLAVFTLGELFEAARRLEQVAWADRLDEARAGWQELAPRLRDFVAEVTTWAATAAPRRADET